MKELKCPRCKNEELKGNENYCPICGLDLKDKTAQFSYLFEPSKIVPGIMRSIESLGGIEMENLKEKNTNDVYSFENERREMEKEMQS